MNLEKINKKIKEKGLKKGFLAIKLGITPTAFGRKIQGKNMFTIEEIKKLANILVLSDEEKLEIFL